MKNKFIIINKELKNNINYNINIRKYVEKTKDLQESIGKLYNIYEENKKKDIKILDLDENSKIKKIDSDMLSKFIKFKNYKIQGIYNEADINNLDYSKKYLEKNLELIQNNLKLFLNGVLENDKMLKKNYEDLKINHEKNKFLIDKNINEQKNLFLKKIKINQTIKLNIENTSKSIELVNNILNDINEIKNIKKILEGIYSETKKINKEKNSISFNNYFDILIEHELNVNKL